MSNTHDDWTEIVPQEEGDYYFYGDISFKKDDPNFNPELSILHIYKISNGMMYVIAGNFFHPKKDGSHEGYGKFKKVDFEKPEL